MDAAALREDLEDEKGTELERVGSNRALIALTDATLETEAVLRAAAASEAAAHETFAGWADDESEADARDLFAWVAEREADHHERVLEAFADDDAAEAAPDPSDDAGPMHTYLRGREGAVQRVAAGLVGRPLVSVRTHLQVVSFFVNEADEARADLFRDLRAETEEELDRGLAYLDAHCEGDDWERARSVAAYTIRIAYDEYADALEGLGVDVRPVC